MKRYGIYFEDNLSIPMRHIVPCRIKVEDLKKRLGVSPHKVLARISPNGVEDLADNATILVWTGDRFMQHARSGGSS